MVENGIETPISEAKVILIALYFSGLPQHDVPFLWALACEIKKAINIILGNPKFAYLDALFADRRCPSATRIHYALASIEDRIVSELEKAIVSVAPGARVMTLLFDGFVVEVLPSQVDAVKGAVLVVAEENKVNVKVREFEQTM